MLFTSLIIVTFFTDVFSQASLFSYFQTFFLFSICVSELSKLNKDVLMNYAIGLLYASFNIIVN